MSTQHGIFNTPREVEVSGRGRGQWLGILDRGPDHPILCLVELKAGDVLVVPTEEIRGAGIYQSCQQEQPTGTSTK